MKKYLIISICALISLSSCTSKSVQKKEQLNKQSQTVTVCDEVAVLKAELAELQTQYDNLIERTSMDNNIIDVTYGDYEDIFVNYEFTGGFFLPKEEETRIMKELKAIHAFVAELQSDFLYDGTKESGY